MPDASTSALHPALPRPKVLPLRQRSDVIHRVLKKRLETVLPAAMHENGFDMWLVLCQEDNWDPIHDTFCPMDPWRPILQMLVFFDRGPESGVERINLSMTNMQGLYDTPWQGKNHLEQMGHAPADRRGGRPVRRRPVSAHPRAAERVLSLLTRPGRGENNGDRGEQMEDGQRGANNQTFCFPNETRKLRRPCVNENRRKTNPERQNVLSSSPSPPPSWWSYIGLTFSAHGPF